MCFKTIYGTWLQVPKTIPRFIDPLEAFTGLSIIVVLTAKIYYGNVVRTHWIIREKDTSGV